MTARTRIQVAALTAALLVGIVGVSYVVGLLLGAPTERPEPEPAPAGAIPEWLDELIYGGGA